MPDGGPLRLVHPRSDRVLAELRGLSCTSVTNAEYVRGMNTSLRAGIRALPEGTDAAVVLLGDMPLVETRMVLALVEAFRGSAVPLVISTYGGVVAPGGDQVASRIPGARYVPIQGRDHMNAVPARQFKEAALDFLGPA